MPGGLLCAAAMVLSALGCELTTPEVKDTALVTDGTSFRLDTVTVGGNLWYLGEIPYSFTNRTGSTVYIPNCRGSFIVSLEMQESGERVRAWTAIPPLCLSAPIVIESSEVWETTLTVGGCVVGNCAPRIRLPRTAFTRYRIVWHEALSSYDPNGPPWGERIPLEERVSNRFTLRVPD